jgi:hypothetical protein
MAVLHDADLTAARELLERIVSMLTGLIRPSLVVVQAHDSDYVSV